jgi:hypothetical protein
MLRVFGVLCRNDPNAIFALVEEFGLNPREKSSASQSNVAAIHIAASNGSVEVTQHVMRSAVF